MIVDGLRAPGVAGVGCFSATSHGAYVMVSLNPGTNSFPMRNPSRMDWSAHTSETWSSLPALPSMVRR
jgi:hypothetical protein